MLCYVITSELALPMAILQVYIVWLATKILYAQGIQETNRRLKGRAKEGCRGISKGSQCVSRGLRRYQEVSRAFNRVLSLSQEVSRASRGPQGVSESSRDVPGAFQGQWLLEGLRESQDHFYQVGLCNISIVQANI